MPEWTNGEITVGSLLRDGNITETMVINNVDPMDRQKGKGQLSPVTVTLYFSMYNGPWECTQAVVEGRIVRKDGCLSDKYTSNIYMRPLGDIEWSDIPPWLTHLITSRLAVIQHTTHRSR